MDPDSDLSPSLRTDIEFRGLSVAFPGILDLILPPKDLEDPCVSDLPNDGSDANAGPALRSSEVLEALALGVEVPELPLEDWFPMLTYWAGDHSVGSAVLPTEIVSQTLQR